LSDAGKIMISAIQIDSKITAFALEFFCKDATQKQTPNQKKMYKIARPTNAQNVFVSGICKKGID